MKRVFAAAFLTLWIAGCESSTTGPTGVRPGEQFQLKYGQTASVPAAGLTVTFKDLGEDSRCPEGALCVWAGNARVIVTLSNEDASLNTTLEPREASHAGYKVQLLAVYPYPKMNERHEPENYVITLVVTKE